MPICSYCGMDTELAQLRIRLQLADLIHRSEIGLHGRPLWSTRLIIESAFSISFFGCLPRDFLIIPISVNKCQQSLCHGGRTRDLPYVASAQYYDGDPCSLLFLSDQCGTMLTR
jgi:hypothetical protein